MAILDVVSLPTRSQPLETSTTETSDDMSRYPKRKRAEVKYYSSASEEDEDPTDSESELISPKRSKSTRPAKPLPPRKVFPFMRLPAELRNRIYEECFPDMPTLAQGAESGSICFRFKQRAYRRSVEQYVPTDQDELDGIYAGNPAPRTGTGRGRSSLASASDDDASDEDEAAGDPASKKLGLSILALNMAIYHEAAPMVYRQRLVFADTVALMGFASVLSPRTAKMLRHVEIRDWNLTRSRKTMPFVAMTLLAARGATNIEKMHLNCSVGWFDSWRSRRIPGKEAESKAKKVARRIYRDCFPWLEAVGIAKMREGGSKWAGVEALQLEERNFENEGMEDEIAAFVKELKRLLRPAFE